MAAAAPSFVAGRSRANQPRKIPASPPESRTPKSTRNAPSTASEYCWNDDTRNGPSWMIAAPTTAPYTLVGPPKTDAARTAKVVVMVNGPGFEGEMK